MTSVEDTPATEALVDAGWSNWKQHKNGLIYRQFFDSEGKPLVPVLDHSCKDTESEQAKLCALTGKSPINITTRPTTQSLLM